MLIDHPHQNPFGQNLGTSAIGDIELGDARLRDWNNERPDTAHPLSVFLVCILTRGKNQVMSSGNGWLDDQEADSASLLWQFIADAVT